MSLKINSKATITGLISLLVHVHCALDLRCVDVVSSGGLSSSFLTTTEAQTCTEAVNILNSVISTCASPGANPPLLACTEISLDNQGSKVFLFQSVEISCAGITNTVDGIVQVLTGTSGSFQCSADGFLRDDSSNCSAADTLAPLTRSTLQAIPGGGCKKIVTGAPTAGPSGAPTAGPTSQPSIRPSANPTPEPTGPTRAPTFVPSQQPTSAPAEPTSAPSRRPSVAPIPSPSAAPSNAPSLVDIPSIRCFDLNADSTIGVPLKDIPAKDQGHCDLIASALNSILKSCNVAIKCRELGSLALLSADGNCTDVALKLGNVATGVAFGNIDEIVCTPLGLLTPVANCETIAQHLDAAVSLFRQGSTASCRSQSPLPPATLNGFNFLSERGDSLLSDEGGTTACIFRGSQSDQTTSFLNSVQECADACAGASNIPRCIGFNVLRVSTGLISCTTYYTPGFIVGVHQETPSQCYVASRPENAICVDIPTDSNGVLGCPIGKYISMITFAMLSGTEGSCLTGFTTAVGIDRCDVRDGIEELCLGRTTCGLSSSDSAITSSNCGVERPLPPASFSVTAGNISNRLQVQGVCTAHNNPDHTRTSTTTTTHTTTTSGPECDPVPTCDGRCYSNVAIRICEPLGDYWDDYIYQRTFLHRDTCYCDNLCETFRDCCRDKNTFCHDATITPPQTTPGTTTPMTTQQNTSTAATRDALPLVEESSTIAEETTDTPMETTTPGLPETEKQLEEILDDVEVGRSCTLHFHCGQSKYCAGNNSLSNGICSDCYACTGATSYTGICPEKCDTATSTTTTFTSTTELDSFCSSGTQSALTTEGVTVCCPSYCSSCVGLTEEDSQGCELNAFGVSLYPDSFECCMFVHLRTSFGKEPHNCESATDVSCLIGDPCTTIPCAPLCAANGCGWSTQREVCKLGATTTAQELQDFPCT